MNPGYPAGRAGGRLRPDPACRQKAPRDRRHSFWLARHASTHRGKGPGTHANGIWNAARDVIAALGPGIGQCCFEVGPEVAAEFAAKFLNAQEWFKGPLDSLARARQRSELAPVANQASAGPRFAGPTRPSGPDRCKSRDSQLCRCAAHPYFFLGILYRLSHGPFLQLSPRAHHWPHDGRHWYP